ncbi:DMT family transporter [Streptomyces sp. NPDC102384]|uniref:DMT family transporter n=1 Tax=Streptomyces sp. NPDC102384 TaxID=3366166 RepID=UPI003828A86D
MTFDKTSLALAATVLLWASAFPAIRVALDGYGPAALSFVRLASASLALLAVAPFLGVRRPRRTDLPRILVVGACGMSAYQLLLNWGETRVPAGTASLIVASVPAISALLAVAFLGERPTWRTVAGSGTALAGCALIALAGGETGYRAAAWAVMGAAVVQAVYHFAIKPLLRHCTGLEVACYAMWAGTALLLPLAPGALGELVRAPADATLAALYLGLLPSAAGFVVWGYAVARLTVTAATAALYLVPGVALVVAYLWLGEAPTSVEAVGGAVTLAGVVLLGRAGPKGRGARKRRGAPGESQQCVESEGPVTPTTGTASPAPPR